MRALQLQAGVALTLAAFFLFVKPRAEGAETETNTPATVTVTNLAVRARRIFVDTRARYQADRTNAETAWHFARACFDLADFAPNKSERAELAETGIKVSKELIAREPKLAAAHYYLGMNIGQLARTRLLSALRLVDQMEAVFLKSRSLDERFDYGGADRNLGLLYLDAPSIGSIGSKTKARFHLNRAVELAPEYPENRINLVEAHIKWGEQASAAREMKALEAILPEARNKFKGIEWAASWLDWEKRIASAKKKLEPAPSAGGRK